MAPELKNLLNTRVAIRRGLKQLDTELRNLLTPNFSTREFFAITEARDLLHARLAEVNRAIFFGCGR